MSIKMDKKRNKFDQAKKKRKFSLKEDPEPIIATGIYFFSNGDKYDGDYMKKHPNANPLRHGLGDQTCVDGTSYQGTWEGDKMHGHGRLVFASGNLYEGGFQHNMFHGHGRYTWANGSFYEGGFVENRMVGEGRFVDTEGQEWNGQFDGKFALALRFNLNLDQDGRKGHLE